MHAVATLTRRGDRERGQAVIELALTLPLLLVIVLGIFDFGFMFQRYEVVTNAAREGARLAVLPEYQNVVGKNQAQTRAISYLQGGGINGNNVSPCATPPAVRAPNPNSMCAVVVEGSTTLAGPPSRTVEEVSVIVEYDHEHVFVGPILQLFGGTLGTVRLRAVSTMRKE